VTRSLDKQAQLDGVCVRTKQRNYCAQSECVRSFSRIRRQVQGWTRTDPSADTKLDLNTPSGLVHAHRLDGIRKSDDVNALKNAEQC
jgi:hypothetical protein